MTSWAQPKLTPSIYVTARDDRAKVAYKFFFLSQQIGFLCSEREEVGYFGSYFINMSYLHTLNILPTIPAECLDEGIKKKKKRLISCCSLAERMRFRGVCALPPSKSIVSGYQGNI